MIRRLLRCALLLPLLLSGCGVVLTMFAVPLQATPGSVATVTIAGNISGTTGEAGCVLQLPNGWIVQSVTNNQNWVVARDQAPLLASYVAEPGHYLAGFSGTGQNPGHGGPQTISQITLTVSVAIPANAAGAFSLKLSLAGSSSTGAWQIAEPAGVSQFAAITAAPYARPILIGKPGFAGDSSGLPPETVGATWSGAAFGDVDGDGREDLVAVHALGGGTRFWLARPGTTWIEHSSGLPASTGRADVAFGHLDSDGLLDLVDGNGQVCFGNGGTSWTQGAPLPLTLAATAYRSIAVGDVNGDGLADIAIGAALDGTLQVLVNNGNRTFHDASAGLPAAATGDIGGNLLLADLDGDGDLDLLWAHWLTPNLWLGDGQGTWTPGLGIPNHLTAAAHGDIDGDNVPEIFVVGGTGSGSGIGVFRHAAGTSWAPMAAAGLPTTGSYSSLVVLDFDRDGLLDLVAGRSGLQGGVEAWRNTGAGFALDTFAGLPNVVPGYIEHLATGDFDGNTFPDLVLTTSVGLPGSTGSLRTFQNRHTGAASFGTGCAGGTFGEPLLVAFGAPQRGSATFAVQVQTQAPGVVAAFWLGFTRVSTGPVVLPLDLTPLGAPGCTIWASIDYLAIGPVDAAGDYTVALPVPNDPGFAFLTLFGQGALWAASANPFGMVFTDALALRIE